MAPNCSSCRTWVRLLAVLKPRPSLLEHAAAVAATSVAVFVALAYVMGRCMVLLLLTLLLLLLTLLLLSLLLIAYSGTCCS